MARRSDKERLELRDIINCGRNRLSELKLPSRSSKERTRHFTRILMIVIKYPSAVPKDFLEHLVTHLITSRHDEGADEDALFIMKYFSEFTRAAAEAETEHALQWAESIATPKETGGKK